MPPAWAGARCQTQPGYAGMNASGNTIKRAPSPPATAIKSHALVIVASRSKYTGAACMAAILEVAIGLCLA